MTVLLASAALLLSSTMPALASTQTASATPMNATSPQAESTEGKGIRLKRFIKRQSARLMTGDKDGDGKISQAEFIASHPQGNAGRQFARLDTDRDGFLTNAEAETTLTARFRRLDANGDGVLDASERPKAAARQRADAGDAEQ